MKKKKQKEILTKIVALVLTITMLIPSEIKTEAKDKVALSKSSISIYVGESVQLKIKNTKVKTKWSSKNKTIAVVNSNGKVTGKKKGATIIIARVGKRDYKCKVQVKDSVQNNTIAYAKPYQKSDIGDIYNGDNYFTMMGKRYYYGFCGEPCYNSWAQYNLNGKYEKMSFTIGHVDNTAQEDATFIIELDGVKVEEIALTGDMTTLTKTIDVYGAQNMKIHIRDAKHVTSLYGVANIVFDKSISLLKNDSSTCNISKGNITYGIPYQKGDIGEIYKGDTSFIMMGKRYYYGFCGDPCYNCFAQINLEKKYKTMSYKIGHIDNTAQEDATMQIWLDGKLIDEVQLSGDMNTLSRTINVTNGTNLKLILRNADYITSWYGIADMILK